MHFLPLVKARILNQLPLFPLVSYINASRGHKSGVQRTGKTPPKTTLKCILKCVIQLRRRLYVSLSACVLYIM